MNKTPGVWVTLALDIQTPAEQVLGPPKHTGYIGDYNIIYTRWVPYPVLQESTTLYNKSYTTQLYWGLQEAIIRIPDPKKNQPMMDG